MFKKPLVLAILDGFGYSANPFGNAIHHAQTPFLDWLQTKHDSLLLAAAGEYVGLPKDQIGNSEVGHIHIGAGRVLPTGLALINQSIQDGTIANNTYWQQVLKAAQTTTKRIHFLGLLSAGGVHSHQNHLFALIKLCKQNNIIPIVHAFGDGRDVSPQTLLTDLAQLQVVLAQNNGILASLMGRFYAMDRDQRWERTFLAYNTLIGHAKTTFQDPVAYVKQQYEQKVYDEFILPAFNQNHLQAAIQPNDVVVHFNFRPDRARQLSHCFVTSSLYQTKPQHLVKVFYATMMRYEGIIPNTILFPPQHITQTLGEIWSQNQLKQLRLSETEKYAHVTFFFDGGIEVNWPYSDKLLLPSPKVQTYDLCPQMAAEAITDALLKRIKAYDIVVLNFANADMVGHTGNFKATIAAVQTLDIQLARIHQALETIGGVLFVTADHGNAEAMLTVDNKPITKHTTNPVWFLSNDPCLQFKKHQVYGLANIAPSLLTYCGLQIPKVMKAASFLACV